jgi:hypothetical protein
MKKKMLFIFPNYYGFDEVIYQGFISYTNYEINRIDSNEEFTYNNIRQKILNLFSKFIFKKNLKHYYFKQKKIKNTINKEKNYDLIFVNRPDLLSIENLKLLERKSEKRIVYYWDSFEKIPATKNTMIFFNNHFSFDTKDCTNFKMNLISNFYVPTNNNVSVLYDFYFLGTYDQRYSQITTIFNKLINRGFTCGGYIYSNKLENIINKQDYLEYSNKIVPFKDSFLFAKRTKFILDIAHENQSGLSFRIFEGICLRKKVITTNKNVVNYDFYDMQNIYLLNDINEEIPDYFLELPYKELSIDIYNKYSLKSWVNTILR